MAKDVQVNFRMPADLKASLQRAATGHDRSLTAEIVARLENSLLGETSDEVGSRFLADIFGGLFKVDEVAESLGISSRGKALNALELITVVSIRLAFPMHMLSLAMSRLTAISDAEGGESDYLKGLTKEEAADFMRDLARAQVGLSNIMGEALALAKDDTLSSEARRYKKTELFERIERGQAAIVRLANETQLFEGYEIIMDPNFER